MRGQLAGLAPAHITIKGEQRPVVAAVHLATWPGEIPSKLAIITAPDGDMVGADESVFTVHYVHQERPGQWEPYRGIYALNWQAALTELVTRAAEKGPAPMVIRRPHHIV